jgi:hypothetical protein
MLAAPPGMRSDGKAPFQQCLRPPIRTQDIYHDFLISYQRLLTGFSKKISQVRNSRRAVSRPYIAPTILMAPCDSGLRLLQPTATGRVTAFDPGPHAAGLAAQPFRWRAKRLAARAAVYRDVGASSMTPADMVHAGAPATVAGEPREARPLRMISFSASTTRKNTKPPSSSQGQTRSGMASVSNSAWSGGA